jgi:serine/threonine protein kinase/WD40 repeat protein
VGSDKDTLPSLSAKQSGPKPGGEDLPFEHPGRYEQKNELGRGGLGRVVLATDLHLRREVAIKELLPELAERRGSGADALIDRFLREARITARLEHPGIVPVHELGKRNDGSLYYSMRRIQGRTLASALEAAATLEDRLTLLPHYLSVVQTIAYAHSKRVIHRDLKPDNVMIGPFGETQVVDWGLARDLEEKAAEQSLPASEIAPGVSASRTVHGQALGTPAYMAPEQARGEIAAMDERSDVWALGVMLYELITGEVPFNGGTAAEVMAKVQEGQYPPPTDREPRAPRKLVELLEQSVQSDRSKRFASAVQFAEALEKAMALQTLPSARPAWLSTGPIIGAVFLVGLLLGYSLESGPAATPAVNDNLELSRSLAERAQQAWDVGDVAGADRLSQEALAKNEDPLARGVRALVRLSGLPKKVWQVKAAAPCGAIAADNGLLACPSLNGVELYGEEGEDQGLLSTGPTGGWQRAAVFLDPGTLVSAGDDRVLHVFDVAAKTEKAKWTGHKDVVEALAVTPEGAVISGSRDGEVRWWSRDSGQSKLLYSHAGSVRALAASPGGVASAASDGVKLMGVSPEGELVAQLTLDQQAWALSFSDHGLLAAIQRGLWRLSVKQAPEQLSTHLDDVTSVWFSKPLGPISSGDDGVLHANPADRWPQTWSGLPRVVSMAGYDSQSEAFLFLAGRERELVHLRWPVDRRQDGAAPGPALATAFTVDTDSAWAGFSDGTVRHQINSRNWQEPLSEKHVGPVRAIAAGGGVLVSLGEDGRLLRHGEQGGEVLKVESRGRAVAVAPDGKRVAASFDDGTVVFFSLEFGKEIARARAAPVNALAFDPKGVKVAAATEEKTVRLYEAESGKELFRLEPFDAPVSSVAFSADGGRLLAGGADGHAVLWSLDSKQAINHYVGPHARLSSMAFLTDASVAAGNDQGSVFVWNASSAVQEVELRLRARDVGGLAVRERVLWVTSSDGVPRQLGLPLGR